MRILEAWPARATPPLGGDEATGQRFLAEGEDDGGVRDEETLAPAFVIEAQQQVADEVEARSMLVVGADHRPWRKRHVRAAEHLVPRLAVLRPELRRLHVDRAQLPLLQRVAAAIAQALLLLALADVEIIFEEVDAVARQKPLELGHGIEEIACLLPRA